ncbi:MAG: NADH-quinone oxidoreductase subunit J [Deltaproteobacteria bacterium]|nr:NADH-quinone oxidoreductase subunit J [Deltaproteobacteria bacterium]
MSVLDVIFLVLSALMLGSSLMVITSRNQVYAAMWLVASMFFLAAIYALLGAHTLAILQVLVYAGAIVVLFLFVIMLLNIQESPRVPLLQSLSIMRVLAVAAVVGVGVVLVAVSLAAPMRSKVKSVTHNEDGEVVVSFDATPFRGSQYAAGILGTGKIEHGGQFDVLRVTGMQGDLKHVIQPGSVLPAVGDMVELTPAAPMLRPEFGTIAELGNQMYGPDLLAFEVTSLLLLVSIVGAVVVAKGKI